MTARGWSARLSVALAGPGPSDRSARSLNQILGLLFFASVASIAFVLGFDVGPTHLAVSLVSYSVALLALHRMTARGYFPIASLLTVASTCVLLAYVVVLHGVRSLAAVGYVTMVMVAGAALGSRASLATAGIASGFLVLVCWAEITGWITPDLPSLADGVHGLIVSFQIAITGVFVWAIVRARDRANLESASFVENCPDGMLTVDSRGVILAVNPAFCEIAGLTREKLLGRGIEGFETMDVGTTQAVFRGIGQIIDGVESAHIPVEIFATRSDGTGVWTECKASRIELENGSPGVLIVVRDINRRRKAETHMLNGARLDSINRLAGGIAHDFNNILMIILGNAELLCTADASRKNSPEVDAIVEASERGGRLLRQLLLLGRNETAPSAPVDVSTLVLGLRNLMSSLGGEHIDLRIDVAPDARVRCAPIQLEQILVNLVMNARDSIGSQGSISISVRNERGSQPEADTVVLSVTDDGSGMTPEVRARAFEPLFSTKQAGSNSGLGLAVVNETARRLGGRVAIDSEPGRGTTVVVEFPATADALAVTEPADENRPRHGRETILLTEDNDPVRQVALRQLRSAGYAVLEAASASEAVVVSDSYSGEVDLLVSDVVMPIVNGVELAMQLRSRRPDMKVLLISGYTGDALKSHLDVDSVTPLLYKPFSSQALLMKVREVLDGPSDWSSSRIGNA